jgi:hypothetical protein
MEVISKIQGYCMENTFTIGITLVIVVLILAIMWYMMSNNASKNPTLENNEIVNSANTVQVGVPTQEQMEDSEKFNSPVEPSESSSPHESSNSGVTE